MDDYPVQRHEMSGLGSHFIDEFVKELATFSAPAGNDHPLWVLEGITAAQERLDFKRAYWALTARRAGSSWTEIGAALGISKQAAAKRFGGMGA